VLAGDVRGERERRHIPRRSRQIDEILDRNPDVSDDLPQEARRHGLPVVPGHGHGAAIGVPVANVTPRLTDRGESKLAERAVHLSIRKGAKP